MANEIIRVPSVIEGREFYAETDADKKEYGIPDALEACQKEHLALFMPRIIDARISSSPKDSPIWQWHTAPSVKVTGKTRQGKPVVVYAHIPNYFSKPVSIRKAIEKGLRNGAGAYPQGEFQKLLDLEDNENVFIVDCDTLKNSKSDVISLTEALSHPQTIPFLGGKDRAEAYLDKHKTIFGEKIGNWHQDDLDEVPRARVLYVGDYDYGLNGDGSLDCSARFVGVPKSAEGTSQKILPSKRQLLRVVSEFVAPFNIRELEGRIEALYK